MPSLNQIAFEIFNKIRPKISDDELLDLREIKSEINKQRALWVRNELNKNRTIDDNIVQEIGCLNIEPTDNSSCCNVPIGCDIMRSVVKIPNFVELHNSPAITRVSSIDRSQINFSIIPYSRSPYVGNGKFNKNIVYVFLLNGYIYLVSKSFKLDYLEKINIRGVFENPSELAEFVACNNQPCYTDDDEYPINQWMLPYIEAEVIKKFINTLQLPVDNTNDAKSTGSQIIEK
jgi:hypothetical protein